MSIVELRKVTVLGLAREKTEALEALQRAGCAHLVSLRPDTRAKDDKPTERPEDCLQALKYLKASGRRRHQVVDVPDFDVDRTVAEVLDNRQRVRETVDRHDMLAKRIKDREPWGDFEFPDRDDLGGYRFWFYIVPLSKKSALAGLELPWEIVYQDNLSAYVLVISPDEPPASLLPVARIHTGSESLATLKRQLEETEIELDALKANRDGLTRWIHLLEQNIASAEDSAALGYAQSLTRDDDALFAVQGWVPVDNLDDMQAYADEHGLALLVEEPSKTDEPPTLLDNADAVAGGADLVSFYQTPAYSGWDPSTIVLFSFALFFAMILGDAGYGLLLTGLLGMFWKRMGGSDIGRRMRSLFAVITVLSVGYGVLAGSYFGLNPAPDSVLGSLQVLELDNFNAMIRLSVIIGALHVALANVMAARVHRRWRDRVVPLSWNAVIAGALLLWLFGMGDSGSEPMAILSWLLMIAGALGVLAFGSDREVKTPKDALFRFLGGLLSLTNITKVFGDVLSYLRLFALGLASASLAITFNQLADDAAAASPGAGLLLKILILTLGHGLNLALAIVSGVVHGLRLNFIEFFNWGMEKEGYPFRPFRKKEIEL
ncbi:MAG: V-type ATP synthase subunit I [Woeseiaceae bacterium]|nr:V-type ATP synthase subunit I [Woeseiaceae bacterium]